MRHLSVNDQPWCDLDLTGLDSFVEDPREATCLDCLQRAASYGAAAAMRGAAVEAAGAVKDPELEAERDEAIKQLDGFRKAFAGGGGFVCESCTKCFNIKRAVLEVGSQRWCDNCASASVS